MNYYHSNVIKPLCYGVHWDPTQFSSKSNVPEVEKEKKVEGTMYIICGGRVLDNPYLILNKALKNSIMYTTYREKNGRNWRLLWRQQKLSYHRANLGEVS